MAMFRAVSAAARGLAASNSVAAAWSSTCSLVLKKSLSGAAAARQQPWQSAATLKGTVRPSSSASAAFASSAAAAAAAAAAATATRRVSSSFALPFSSFRRSHLDFPRRESTLQRLFGKSGPADSDTVLYSLIGLNLGVYTLWQVNPSLARAHFVVSAAALTEGRLHTLVTSAFSHHGPTHLLVNMVSLFFFGRAVGRALGGRALASLYLAAGAGGSLAHCAAASWRCLSLPPGSPNRRFCVQRSPGALGASAAVNGVVVLSCLAWPSSTVLLWGILPVPAALLGAAFVLQDVLGAWRDIDIGRGGGGGSGGRGGVAHAGHLGGAAVGALAWAALRRRRRW